MTDKKLTTDSIKQLLNQSVAQMEDTTIGRLHAARNRALEGHRALQDAPALAWLNHHGVWIGSPSTGHKLQAWTFALIFAAFLLGGVAYMQQLNEHKHDNSEIDIAILTDDLPVDAYVEL